MLILFPSISVMNNILLVAMLPLVQGSYVTEFKEGSAAAVDFYREWHALISKAFGGAKESDLVLAYSIVAPEVSQYDAFKDFLEIGIMKKRYVADGSCDYSIGYFQMKPSFVESLENEVFKSASLKKKYGKMLAYSRGKSKRTVRKERLDRLSETEWQIRYLAIYVDVAKQRTAKWGLKSSEEKLRYWASMYNAGFYLSKARVKQRQTVRQFPRSTTKYNYSAVAVELYRRLLKRK
ncbi:MAG: hypothetical protein IKJ95_03125 [Bacteroidaceae bacterium]|nr:hypothetical protein [Bacteroidaceae bacterium]